MKGEHVTIALIGGGPSAMFLYKQLLNSGLKAHVTIFEKTDRLGAGMPYSRCGAEQEHVTNVSSNEIPELPQTPMQWWESRLPNNNHDTMIRYSPYKVFPRRLFGDYLEAQFKILLEQGKQRGVETEINLNTAVDDIQYSDDHVIVTVQVRQSFVFDKVVICTGHSFPVGDKAPEGYYASPYPPKKLAMQLNHPVAIRGASLTAVDAIKTLARANGEFKLKTNNRLVYKPHDNNHNFKIVLHCRSGMLPSVRFHLADSHLKNPSLLTDEQIEAHRKSNGGFLSLDYIFKKDFIEPLKTPSPDFYNKVKDMSMEEFVSAMLELRERIEPFTLLKSECNEAEKSIKRKESIYWKEMLGVLSFAMNYPAKYFSAEDMLRYKATLHPLISLVIAYIPQSSCRELLALHKAGCLDIINVGTNSSISRNQQGGITYCYIDENGDDQEIFYKTYVDCTGQPHINFDGFPFKGLSETGVVSQARLPFRNAIAAQDYAVGHAGEVEADREGNYYLKVSGIAVNDAFQVVEKSGRANTAIFMMAVPYMGGYNPDYSGLDFSEEAAHRIIAAIGQEQQITATLKHSEPSTFKPLESVA